MAIDFPASPTNGQTFTSGTVTYAWDGVKWTAVAAGGGATDKIIEGNTSAEVIDTGSDGRFVVTTEGSERLRVDSSGRLGLGTTTPESYGQFAIRGATTVATWGDTSAHFSDATTGSLYVSHSSNRVSLKTDADLDLFCNNADSIIFSTNAVERMRITSDGDFLIEKTAIDATTQGFQYDSGGAGLNATVTITNTRTDGGSGPFRLNRQGSDGTLIHFLQANTEEGSISVSGTTVSYNGAHLSRWSQLPSGAEREEILRGTVLSNLDEMCEWGDEANEQLNRMKVSDVEGDKNVAGVFQSWDDSDDTYTNDFYCAMTGDMIIRIAENVTVERGDLLMSAGDGTAKPQDDDIIRSKTIAKVTSTNVSCTYDDGSYCVPCVLMAC